MFSNLLPTTSEEEVKIIIGYNDNTDSCAKCIYIKHSGGELGTYVCTLTKFNISISKNGTCKFGIFQIK